MWVVVVFAFSRCMKKIGIIINILFSAVFLFILLLVFLSYFNNPLKLRLYGIASQSMYPALKKGDLILVKRQNNYKKKDIITFSNPIGTKKSDTVTHRIIDITKEKGHIKYKTKGDANNKADGWKIGENSIVGVTIYSLPLLGYIISISKTPIGFILLILIPAFILLYSEILNIKKELRKLFLTTKYEENSD